MASRQELRALITIAGRIDPSLQSAMLRASGESMRLSRNVQSSAGHMSRVAAIAKGAFLGSLASKAFSTISSRVVGVAADSVKLASDLYEVQNVVDTTFGQSSNQINAWSQTALKAYGLSELQAKQFTGTMGAMMKSSGVSGDALIKMSENLTGLAGDLASFRNLSPEEAFQKIQSGISGETEPLKQIGINMSVANMEAFAMSKGIKTSYQNMDQASQVALRYNYLLSVTKDAQGDFAKTAGGFANQTRLLHTNLAQLSAKMAQNLLPVLAKGEQKMNAFLEKFTAGPQIGKISSFIGNVGANIYGLAQKIGPSLGNIFTQLAPVAAQFFNVLANGSVLPMVLDTVSKLAPIIGSVAMSILPLLATGFQIVMSVIQPLIPVVSQLVQQLAPIITQIAGALLPLFQALVPVISFLASVIANVLGAALKFVVPIISWLVDKLSGLIGIITRVVGGLGSVFGSIGSALGFSPPSVPKFASGGIAIGPSIFGEAGPEMAIPLQRTPRNLGLLNQTARILGAGGNMVNITYAPVINGPDSPQLRQTLWDSADDFARRIEEYFSNQGRMTFG
jgi:hypothetical protein